MRRPAALFPIVLALGALIFVSGAGAQEPTKITACQTISQPGSYRLANNLAAIPPGLPACLVITANFVTIDLGGFSMTQRSAGEGAAGTGVLAGPAAGHCCAQRVDLGIYALGRSWLG
jgi:hypothetical protein